MKNLKNILVNKKMDFSAIQIFISVIAIFYVSIVTGQTKSSSELDLYAPVVRTLASESHSCPIPYKDSFCTKEIEPMRFCKMRSKNQALILNIPNLLIEKPLCSISREHNSIATLLQNS